MEAPLVAEHRLQGMQASGTMVHGLSCLVSCGVFPDQGSNLCPLTGRFLTTGPPVKYKDLHFIRVRYFNIQSPRKISWWSNFLKDPSWNSNTLATWCEELTHLKRPWCWERLGAGGEGNDRGWDSWMASSTRWTWVWVNSGSWWWTGRPGILRFMGSQRVRHDRATELNWTECGKQQGGGWGG